MISKKWLMKYGLAKKYYEEHGDLLISRLYVEKANGKVVELGTWICNQRGKYKGTRGGSLLESQIKMLEDIGMVWDVKKYSEENIDKEWLKKYGLAKKYYKEHGNLLISQSYIVTFEDEEINLGTWLTSQRMLYKGTRSGNLLETQIKMLEDIGMVWDVKKYKKENINKNWLKKYELAKKYYEEHGDLLISANYIEEKNGEIINLGDWINTQRKAYKNINNRFINKKQIQMLEDIGMVWDAKKYKKENIDKEWLKKYGLAKKYYEEHGNLLISQSYIVTFEDEEINLGTWLTSQRMKYKGTSGAELSYKQIQMLEDIGMVWDVKKYSQENIDKEWLKKYGLAKKYYEEHGNLLISQSYIVTFEDEEINLGTWLNTQRNRYKGTSVNKLLKSQIKMLEDIGMVWEFREYKRLEKFLWKQYMLYEQNMLSENDIIKLLDDGVLVYSDSEVLQKANTLEFYRKKYINS